VQQHASFAKYDHVSPLLQELYTGCLFLIPERIKYRLAVLVVRCRHNLAPEYRARDLQWADDIDSRQRLRSSSIASGSSDDQASRCRRPRFRCRRCSRLQRSTSDSLLQQSTAAKTYEDLLF